MPKLYKIKITANEDTGPRLTAFLFQHISSGWEEKSQQDGTTLFTLYTDNAEVLQGIQKGLEAEFCTCTLSIEEEEQKDWQSAWHEFFTPIEAGNFVVLPPWLLESHDCKGKQALVIEPKSAFGTGHHFSTALCLKAFSLLQDKKDLPANGRFLDIGTGSGILGISAALYGLSGVLVDNDPIAIDNAVENAEINKVAEKCTIYTGDATKGITEQFDLIFANILAEPLINMAPEICERLKAKSFLILSGILTRQADSVEEAYEGTLGKAIHLQDDEWTALLFGRV